MIKNYQLMINNKVDNLISKYNIMSREKIIEMEKMSKYLTNLESELSQFWQLNGSILCILEGDKLIKVNPSWTRVLGYDKLELLDEHTLYSLVEDSSVKHTLKNIKKLIAKGNPVTFKNIYKHKNGSNVELSWVYSYDMTNDRIYGIAQETLTLP